MAQDPHHRLLRVTATERPSNIHFLQRIEEHSHPARRWSRPEAPHPTNYLLQIMILRWFDATAAKNFGTEMALLIAQKNQEEMEKLSRAKSTRKAEKRHEATFLRIEKELGSFKKDHRLNVYTKAQLGNAFKYTLMDNGFDQEFCEKTTTWLLLKCQ
ncbi:hypothetical protein QTI27_24125 [Variovorax sp. J31P216]|nr:hypothetical protein [Variovorax sp. J31P216]